MRVYWRLHVPKAELCVPYCNLCPVRNPDPFKVAFTVKLNPLPTHLKEELLAGQWITFRGSKGEEEFWYSFVSLENLVSEEEVWSKIISLESLA